MKKSWLARAAATAKTERRLDVALRILKMESATVAKAATSILAIFPANHAHHVCQLVRENAHDDTTGERERERGEKPFKIAGRIRAS